MAVGPLPPAAQQAFDRGIEALIRLDAPQAAAAFETAVRLCPDFVLAHAFLGQALMVGRRPADALPHFTEAIRLDPTLSGAYASRAICLDQLGRAADALADRQRHLAVPQPTNLDVPRRFLRRVYTRPFLDAATQLALPVEPLVRRLCAAAGAVRTYPDGSVQLEGEAAMDEFEAEVGRHVRAEALRRQQAENPFRMELLLGTANYVSLSPFPARQWEMMLWGEQARQYPGGKLVVLCGIAGSPHGFTNAPLDDLPVVALFQRRLKSQAQASLAAAVGAYLERTQEGGLFGEGSVAAASAEVEFSGRIARFRLDLSLSGMNTVTWLILTLVGLRLDNLLTEVVFPHVRECDDFLRAYCGWTRAETVLALPRPTAAPVPPGTPRTPPAGSESFVPAQARLCTWLRAADFQVLTLGSADASDLPISIYLAHSPREQDLAALLDSVRAWLTVGQLGGFEGPFNDHRLPVYCPETTSVELWCDMTCTDHERAVQTLVNVLEGWHTHGVAIEAVVLGQPSPASGPAVSDAVAAIT